jgi:EmrB/QacA subfamily drug resistance transporter
VTDPTPAALPPEDGLVWGEPRSRWVVTATVLGSGLAFLDGSVVNVALPAMGDSLGAGLSGLAWIVNAYALTLASLILLGGSLGDRFGRRRVFVIGVVWFAIASLLCAVAPNVGVLVAARALQGVGGALLTPGSLAILQASFRTDDRARAIGAWSGLAGITGAAGPFVGGWLVQVASWRWIFLINLPVAVAVVAIATRYVPESRDPDAPDHTDVVGAALGAAGLGGLTYGLVAWQDAGPGSASVLVPLVLGVAALAGFVWWEARARMPMLPLGIFRSRLFSATNAVTFLVYAALGGVFFWLVLDLQIVVGFSPREAGLSLLPSTLIMLALSARLGALAQRIGPRIPMTVGPLLAAIAVALMTRIDAGSSYWPDVLVPVVLFGLGLSCTVAPLTATVLAAAPVGHAGVASGVNNAVARVAGLLAVAVLPLVAGLSGEGYRVATELEPSFRTAMWWCSAVLAAGGLLAAALVRRPPAPAEAPAPTAVAHPYYCPIDAPPLRDLAAARGAVGPGTRAEGGR